MKKALFLALVSLFVPMAAFGLEAIPDQALDKITGQAGVSIVMDDIELALSMSTISWMDWDGRGDVFPDAAAVTMGGLGFGNIEIDAIIWNDGTTTPLTFDASGSLPFLGTPGVQIGLPSIDIYTPYFLIQEITVDPATFDAANNGTIIFGSGDSFGQLYLENINLRVLSGTMYIAPH